nr:GNAT family N-acetyltransferase [uncultured Rhodopila sp.]
MPANHPNGENGYRLDAPQCAQDWQAYHGIRRKVFHLPRPDEDTSPDVHPLLLWLEDRPIGAIQVDNLHNAAAALRLVAIDPAHQGGGHGREMLQRAEAFVRTLGCRKAVVYSTVEAAGFYAHNGYDEEDWDAVCMGGVVQMLKELD